MITVVTFTVRQVTIMHLKNVLKNVIFNNLPVQGIQVAHTWKKICLLKVKSDVSPDFGKLISKILVKPITN